MVCMQFIIVWVCDGFDLVCYVMILWDVDIELVFKLKVLLLMVLMVYGGFWDCDCFGFNGMYQWFVDCGYVVLNVNFCFFIGFGKCFVNVGDGEWGCKMDDDLDDVVVWVIKVGIVDLKCFVIVGGSYGGFVVLLVLMKQLGCYVCGVDIVGFSNLEFLFKVILLYWEYECQMFYCVVGNLMMFEGVVELCV